MITLEEAYKIAKKNMDKGTEIGTIRKADTFYLFCKAGKNGLLPVDGKGLGVYKKDGKVEWIWVHPNSKHWKEIYNSVIVEFPKTT